MLLNVILLARNFWITLMLVLIVWLSFGMNAVLASITIFLLLMLTAPILLLNRADTNSKINNQVSIVVTKYP